MRSICLALVLAFGCNPRPPAPPSPAADAEPTPRKRPAAAKDDPAFPQHKVGWKQIGDDDRGAIDTYAAGYLGFLPRARTPRRATAALVELFGEDAHELEDPKRPAYAPGNRYLWRGQGEAMAFIRAGERPLEEGVRVVVASVDAPHIRIKQTPMMSAHNLAMLDTEPYGAPNLASWLVTPLVLDVFLARPGAAAGDLALAIGDDPGEPVLVIPDLLPHLSGKIQKRAVVDSPERMNAVAGRSQARLIAMLQRQGMSARDFAAAEAVLVPAAPPVLLGADRAEIGGYGHEHRALAYAAVDTLRRIDTPHHTSIVIIIGNRLDDYAGVSSLPFVHNTLDRVIAALASTGDDTDVLETRRVYARSAALVGHYVAGDLARGVVLVPHTDDALPPALRRVLRAARAGHAGYQVVGKASWNGPARELANLDMDAVDVAIPIADRALPMQRISTYDLFQAHRLIESWFTGGERP